MRQTISLIGLLAAIGAGFALSSCGGLNQRQPVLQSVNSSIESQLEQQPESLAQTNWPTALPADALQPWEEPAGSRQVEAVSADNEFTTGVERFNESGDVHDLGEASRINSGGNGSSELGYALYRIVLGSTQPGVVSVDINQRQQSDGSTSTYWLGLSRYDQDIWEWYGPFGDSHVRLSLGADVADGADYLSPLGNLFVCIAAYDGAAIDVVGLAVKQFDSADTTQPAAPAAPVLTPVAGGLLVEWLPVVAGDLAGYNVYFSAQSFFDLNSPGIRHVNYLEGATRHLLAQLSGETYVRISAVDHSGNESALSPITSATPLPGSAPALKLSVSAPSGGLAEVITLTAAGADSYDWDLDGDGIYDVTGDSTGSAQADTGSTGIIRPSVRGVSGGGMAIANGAVSLIISGNARPVASGYADPPYGQAPLTVDFTGTGSDPDGEIVLYSWDFDGNGTYDWSDPANSNPPEQVYGLPYLRNVKFRVDDDQGTYDVDTVTVQIVGNQPPLAQLRAERVSNNVPFNAEFDASDSVDLDGSIVQYEWDWESDGSYDTDTGTTPTASHTYDEAFEYTATVRVTDDHGATATASLEILATGVFQRTVTSPVLPAGYISLALVNGKPAISYYDGDNQDLEYIRAIDEYGIAWSSPIIVESAGNTGTHTSLVEVNGHPAIAYVREGNHELVFVRAQDPNGVFWNSPVVVDTDGNVGDYASLKIVNGKPAIGYYDNSIFGLKYVQASEIDGSAWNTPVTVDSAGFTGYHASLAVVNGRPAISYYDATNDSLKFVQASDADGSSWNSPEVADDSANVGAYTSLAVVNGFPAISYFDVTNEDLKYVRATDADGANWDEPVVLDSIGDVGKDCSLAIVGGFPAVSYEDGTLKNLKYIRASDVNGASWSIPVTPDSQGNVGHEPSMMEINGYAAIAYSALTEWTVSYAIIIE